MIKDSVIQRDMPEHYKQMAKFHKNMTMLSIILFAVTIALSSNLYNVQVHYTFLLLPLILFLGIFSISMIASIAYDKAVIIPEVLTSHYGKLITKTAKPLIAILFVALCCIGYVALSL